MQKRASRYVPIEHTADAGIKIFAPDFKGVFESAAQGLFDLIANLDKVTPTSRRQIEIEATDREALLVTWLSELNYLFLTERVIFKKFQITNLDECTLSAFVAGEPLDLEKHEIYTEVKAVTYHGLYIKEADDGCEAQVIFDL